MLMENESADSAKEECLLKADDEEEQPLLHLDQPNGGALRNSKVCISSASISNKLPYRGAVRCLLNLR